MNNLYPRIISSKPSGSRNTLLMLSATLLISYAVAPVPQVQAAPKAKPAATPAKAPEKTTEKADKTPAKAAPEPPIENVVNVTTTELVDKPHEFMNKNVKFTAKFYMFSTLPLDYKPAMKSSKTHLGFIVHRPDGIVPFPELKIAMAIPKEKDPLNQLLTSLKEGDQIEVTAKVFGTGLDEPWVDVLRLKKLASAEDKEKKDGKTASAGDSELPKEMQTEKHPPDVHK
jgi:hypothetical protein